MEGAWTDSACNALDMAEQTGIPPGICAVNSCYLLTFHRFLSDFVDFWVNMEQFKCGGT